MHQAGSATVVSTIPPSVCLTTPSSPPAPVIEVVKEDSSQAASLLPVLDHEVLIAPLLELGVEGGVVPELRKTSPQHTQWTGVQVMMSRRTVMMLLSSAAQQRSGSFSKLSPCCAGCTLTRAAA